MCKLFVVSGRVSRATRFSRLVAQTATSLSLWVVVDVVVVVGGGTVVLVIYAASGLELRRGASFPAFSRHAT